MPNKKKIVMWKSTEGTTWKASFHSKKGLDDFCKGLERRRVDYRILEVIDNEAKAN